MVPVEDIDNEARRCSQGASSTKNAWIAASKDIMEKASSTNESVNPFSRFVCCSTVATNAGVLSTLTPLNRSDAERYLSSYIGTITITGGSILHITSKSTIAERGNQKGLDFDQTQSLPFESGVTVIHSDVIEGDGSGLIAVAGNATLSLSGIRHQPTDQLFNTSSANLSSISGGRSPSVYTTLSGVALTVL